MKIKALMVCDDPTGANASGILLNQLNLKTLSIINYEKAEFIEGYDAVSISTDSRAVDEKMAYHRVKNVLNSLKGESIDVLNKRVDSTLRGNIGGELNAFMELYPNYKIAIVPSYPNSGRVCDQGIVYVNGTILEDTDVAKDPKMPIDSSNAKVLFEKQFNGKLKNIYRDEYTNLEHLKALIVDAYKDNDAIIFDAINNKEIEFVSRALVQSKIKIITVDAGYFTYRYTKEFIADKIECSKRYVYMVGSVTDTTFNQLKYIKDTGDFLIIPLDPEKLILSQDIDECIEEITQKINSTHFHHIIVSTTDVENRTVLDLAEISKDLLISVDDVSKIINRHLAKILGSIVDNVEDVAGVFGSGGDTSLSFLKAYNARGIELVKEVIPMCVYGQICGGKYHGLPMVTKGGMIGNEDAYVIIKRFFEEEVDDK